MFYGGHCSLGIRGFSSAANPFSGDRAAATFSPANAFFTREGLRPNCRKEYGTEGLLGDYILKNERPSEMPNLPLRRKHIDLDEALAAMSDPSLPARDALMIWRKALRRVDEPTKALINRALSLHTKARKTRQTSYR
jgi:hypothetical protein